MHTGALLIAAFPLPDGKALVVGPATAEVYDPAAGSWTALPLSGTGYHAAVQLSDGGVLALGEADRDADQPCTAADRYDPRTGSWTTASTTLGCTASSSFTLLLDGTVLAAGGVDCRSWEVTVDNQSSKPANLFVARDSLELVGSATPNVVPAGATVTVTFLFPANDDGWIYVNPRPGEGGALVNADQIGIPGKIVITADGQVGWLGL